MLAELHIPLPLQHLIKLIKRQLITKLILLILIAVFLDGVVGEVDVDVVEVLGVVLLAAGADVALLEEVELEGVGDQGPYSDVEFAVVY